jgi:hypothetical protein
MTQIGNILLTAYRLPTTEWSRISKLVASTDHDQA